jgi:hypothetical protein
MCTNLIHLDIEGTTLKTEELIIKEFITTQGKKE